MKSVVKEKGDRSSVAWLSDPLLAIHWGPTLRRITLMVALSLLLLLSACAMSDNLQIDPPEVRSRIRELITKINYFPDLLHTEHTPAVDELAAIGLGSLRNGVLELLLTADQTTRFHAQAVLEDITLSHYGFVSGQGWPSKERRLAWHQLRIDMGGYNYKASKHAREVSYHRWRKWVADQTMRQKALRDDKKI